MFDFTNGFWKNRVFLQLRPRSKLGGGGTDPSVRANLNVCKALPGAFRFPGLGDIMDLASLEAPGRLLTGPDGPWQAITFLRFFTFSRLFAFSRFRLKSDVSNKLNLF